MKIRTVHSIIVIALFFLLNSVVTSAGLNKKADSAIQSGTKGDQVKENQSPQDSLIVIELKDGTIVKGKVLKKDTSAFLIESTAGLEVRVPFDKVSSYKFVQQGSDEAKFTRTDPNYSRLMFGPTGRPLKKGEGYFSDYYIFFPGVSYGFTNNFTLMAGFSTIPGANLSQQLKFISPKIGIRASDEFAMSVGALYLTVGGEFAAGIAYGVATFGDINKSLTTGIGFGFSKEEGESLNWADTPILMLGGNIRLSNSIALVSENWIILDNEFGFENQPFGIVLRFFGERVAVDAGFIITAEILKHGFPVPWLSFVYNFGK